MLRLKHNGREINVRFCHRVVDNEFNGKRRCTLAKVIFPDEFIEFNGESTCHPRDNFSKSTGRKIALAYAIVDFDRNLRKAIWQEYHRHCK